jgi:hypothetical protein
MAIDLHNLRSELQAGLTEAILKGGKGRVSPGDASSAAGHVLDGQGLPASIASRFGSDPVCSLVNFDADHIQNWVFASERVQVAQGASATLHAINRSVAEGVRQIQGIHGVVYSAGGGGILLGDAGMDSPELETRVRNWLEAESRELTFTVISLPLFPRDLGPGSEARPLPSADIAGLDRFEVVDGLAGALVRLQVKVREAKDARPRHGGPALLAFQPGTASERCPSCNRRPPSRSPRDDDGPETWCHWCRSLRRAARSLSPDSRERYARGSSSLTFADLAEASSRRRQYLGFVAIDGNGMGSIGQSARDLLQLRAFSEATTAVYESARRKVEDVLARGFLESGWDPSEASLSLLSGGDEITLVLPAAAAPLVTVEILREIEAGFDLACGPGGLLREAFRNQPGLLSRLQRAGAAAGLVTASPQYPVRLLRRYANELQKEAKRACALRGSRSGVAWMLLTDSSPLSEGPLMENTPADLELVGFESFLSEARATQEAAVPRAALQRLVNQYREEDEHLSSLSPGAEREAVLNPLAANFFRYQLARSRELQRWWKTVAPPEDNLPPNLDAVGAWFESGGGRRLEKLVDLLSLEPFPEGAQVVAS